MSFFAAPVNLQECVSLQVPTMAALLECARTALRPWPLPSFATIGGGLDGPLPRREEVAQLTRLGMNRVVLSSRVSLSNGARYGAVELVRFLRDCAGSGLAVDWQADALPPEAASTMVHLSPPCLPDGSLSWAFYFGTYYWRKGSDFAQLVDLRSGTSASKIWLDEPDPYELFMRLQTPVRRPELPARLLAALRLLEDENVTFAAGEWIVALPYRLSKWPTPYGAM